MVVLIKGWGRSASTPTALPFAVKQTIGLVRPLLGLFHPWLSLRPSGLHPYATRLVCVGLLSGPDHGVTCQGNKAPSALLNSCCYVPRTVPDAARNPQVGVSPCLPRSKHSRYEHDGGWDYLWLLSTGTIAVPALPPVSRGPLNVSFVLHSRCARVTPRGIGQAPGPPPPSFGGFENMVCHFLNPQPT